MIFDRVRKNTNKPTDWATIKNNPEQRSHLLPAQISTEWLLSGKDKAKNRGIGLVNGTQECDFRLVLGMTVALFCFVLWFFFGLLFYQPQLEPGPSCAS